MARVVAVESRYLFGLLTFLYIVFLVVPWILTCLQAREPFLLTKFWMRKDFDYDIEVHGIQQGDADHATRFSHVLDGLSYLAAVLALPVLYEILARATVIYTLRTRKRKQLNAAQLFALADRQFLLGFFHQPSRTIFFFFSGLLILATVAYHILRGAVISTTLNRYPLAVVVDQGYSYYKPKLSSRYPNSMDVEEIGRSPGPDDIQSLPNFDVMTKLRQAIIASHPNEWQQDAWFTEQVGSEKAKFFAATLSRNTTTGLIRNLALRMDSEFSCQELYGGLSEAYPEDCKGGEEFPFRHPELELDICVQGNGTGFRDGQYVSPWANTTDKQVITEHIYVRMPELEITSRYSGAVGDQRQYWFWERDYHCTVTTAMGYFVVGNEKNNHTFSPRLDHVNESDIGIIAMGRRYATSSYNEGRGSDMNDAKRPVPGPLTLAARAMFGRGSFFDIAQKISADVPDHANYSAILAGSCPYPLQRHPYLFYDCASEIIYDDNSVYWGAKGVVKLLRNLMPTDSGTSYSLYGGTGRAWELLDSALYMANKAVMDLAMVDMDDRASNKRTPNPIGIFHTEGVAVRQFDMSDLAMGFMSALLGVQVLGILALLCYTFRLHAWTSKLDALAVARIAHQLKDNSLLRNIGLRKPTDKETKKLAEMDALIGVVEPIPLSDMSSTAAATTRASGSGDNARTGRSSSAHGDARSHHSQAPVVPVVSNDPQMGMGTIPIDVQTVISEDLDDNNNNNNTNTNGNNDENRQRNSRILDAPPPAGGLVGPRLSLGGIADMVPDHDDNLDSHANGPSSPPAYTPRTGQPEPNLLPPSYASALAVDGLRVGAPGLVTRRNIPTTIDDVWV